MWDFGRPFATKKNIITTTSSHITHSSHIILPHTRSFMSTTHTHTHITPHDFLLTLIQTQLRIHRKQKQGQHKHRRILLSRMSTSGKESSERTPLRPPSQSRSSSTSININETPTRTTTTTNTSGSGNGSTTPKRRPSLIIMQAPPPLAPTEETAAKASKAVKLALYVTGTYII